MAVLHMRDYKLTFRQASNLEAYPLPRMEDLFASQVVLHVVAEQGPALVKIACAFWPFIGSMFLVFI